jgi:hypothetical protein
MGTKSGDSCSKCGKTRAQIEREIEEAKRRGVHVYLVGGILKYCENCDKTFCGACQIDLGWQGSGCPICRGVVVG